MSFQRFYNFIFFHYTIGYIQSHLNEFFIRILNYNTI